MTALDSRRRGRPGGENPMVPAAEFTSYYGRPVVKPSPWGPDIPAYLFLGGLAGGSSLLAAGADVTGRPALRRASRVGALGALSLSFAALVHDLGRPSRFANMLRVAKPTSPMSVGTWILTAFGPPAGLAAVAEFPRLLPRPLRKPVAALDRPAGLAAALAGPAVATYTAVLLSDTATPTWHAAYRQLPFVFAGSAATAAGGWALLATPTDQAGPARRMAVGGAALELSAARLAEASIGVAAEPLHEGMAGRLMKLSETLTAAGAAGAVLGRRNRFVSAIAGLMLLGGSALSRFGIFHAGQASAQDPKYTVVPQRQRLDERGRTAPV